MKLWHVAVFMLALVAFGVARAPAAFFAPRREGVFDYARVEGTIWSARFERATVGAFDAGAATWRLSLRDLLGGKVVADIDLAGAGLSGHVKLLANWRGDRRIVAERLAITGAPVAPNMTLAGETVVTGLDVFFQDGRCRAAAGAVTSDVLAQNAAALGWAGPQMSGTAACAGDDALIALSGAEGAVQASLLLRANGEGEWRARAAGARPEALAVLAGAGFAPDPRGGGVALTRTIRWLP